MRCSVVIPARNMARYVGEAVESVLAQEAGVADVIVVDDGSTDETREILGRYVSGRVRIIGQEHKGAAAARNRGAAESTGDAVVFLDADDRLLPRAVARFLRALERDPRIAVAYGEVRVIDAEGRPIGAALPPLFRGRPSGDVLANVLRGTPIAAPGAACIRKSSVFRAGPFRDLPAGEDWEFYCRLALAGRFSYLRGDPVLDYRRHPDSLTAVRGESAEALLPAIDAIFGNPAIRARFPAWFLASRRHRCVAGAYGYAGRMALRNQRWAHARRHLLECLRRDPWRPREVIFLLAALARWLPDPLRRRIK